MLVSKLLALGLLQVKLLDAMRQVVDHAIGASGQIESMASGAHAEDLEVAYAELENTDSPTLLKRMSGKTPMRQTSHDSGASGKMNSCDACPESLVIDQACTECAAGQQTCRCGEVKKSPIFYITHSSMTETERCPQNSVSCENGASIGPYPPCSDMDPSKGIGYGMNLQITGNCSYQITEPTCPHSEIQCSCIQATEPCRKACNKPCSECDLEKECTDCVNGRKTCKCLELKQLTRFITHKSDPGGDCEETPMCDGGAPSRRGAKTIECKKSGMKITGVSKCKQHKDRPVWTYSVISCYCSEQRDSCDKVC